MDFAEEVVTLSNKIAIMLIEKNQSYGNAALDPIRVFSKANPDEQLKVRIDDKLGRIKNGKDYPGDNDLKDLIGYLFLLYISQDVHGRTIQNTEAGGSLLMQQAKSITRVGARDRQDYHIISGRRETPLDWESEAIFSDRTGELPMAVAGPD